MSVPEYPSRSPADPQLDLVVPRQGGRRTPFTGPGGRFTGNGGPGDGASGDAGSGHGDLGHGGSGDGGSGHGGSGHGGSDHGGSGQPIAGLCGEPMPDDACDDLAADAREQHARRRSRALVRRSFGRLLRLRRLSHRRVVTALLAEDDRLGAARDPGRPTHGETAIHAAGKAGADAELTRSQRHLEREARGADSLRARQAELYTRSGYQAGIRVRHPDGGQRPVAEVVQDEAAARRQIEDETARGSRKHHQLPWWIGRIPIAVLLTDFCLLLYFFAGITDVDWQSPLGASLVFAVLLAAMVTVLSYGFLAFVGHRLRGYKDHSGAVAFTELDALTKVACWCSAGTILVLSTLMFIRMRAEVLDALGRTGWATALIIALALAVVSAMANFLVVVVHALNGSHQVARLNALSAAVSRPLGHAHEMREEADLIPKQIAVRHRRAQRAAIEAITRAGRSVSAADQAISSARAAHQGAGPYGAAPSDPNRHEHVMGYHDPDSVPRADVRALNTALEHIETDLPVSQP
jgi:hypothetical protein